MSSTINDVTVVYYLMTAFGPAGDKEILRLTAKFEQEIFDVWIKPSKLVSTKIAISSLPRFGFANSEVFLDGVKLSTVSLDMALAMFHGFLKFVPKPILLVTHVSENDSLLLLRSIVKKDILEMFRGVIVGFSNTFPIFREMVSAWPVGSAGLKLTDLVQNLLEKPYTSQWPEAANALICFEELVLKDLFVSELIEISMPLPAFSSTSSHASSSSTHAQQAHAETEENPHDDQAYPSTLNKRYGIGNKMMY